MLEQGRAQVKAYVRRNAKLPPRTCIYNRPLAVRRNRRRPTKDQTKARVQHTPSKPRQCRSARLHTVLSQRSYRRTHKHPTAHASVSSAERHLHAPTPARQTGPPPHLLDSLPPNVGQRVWREHYHYAFYQLRRVYTIPAVGNTERETWFSRDSSEPSYVTSAERDA